MQDLNLRPPACEAGPGVNSSVSHLLSCPHEIPHNNGYNNDCSYGHETPTLRRRVLTRAEEVAPEVALRGS